MIVDRPCLHASLYFGSGGFYVFCLDCPASWRSAKVDYDHRDECMTEAVAANDDGRLRIRNPDRRVTDP